MEQLPKDILIEIIRKVVNKSDNQYQNRYEQLSELLKEISDDSYSYNKINCVTCERFNKESYKQENKGNNKGNKENKCNNINWCIVTVPENSDAYPDLQLEKYPGGLFIRNRNEYCCYIHNTNYSHYDNNTIKHIKNIYQLHKLNRNELVKLLQIVDKVREANWKNKINHIIKYLNRSCINNSSFSKQKCENKDCKEYAIYDWNNYIFRFESNPLSVEKIRIVNTHIYFCNFHFTYLS